jgi:hypothetical protein
MNSADALAQAYQTHLRLVILRLLQRAPGYSLNESLLVDVIPQLGLEPTRDQVRGCLAWLLEQGLVTCDQTGDRPGDLMVAKISGRGIDVALGRATHPGVKRPAP